MSRITKNVLMTRNFINVNGGTPKKQGLAPSVGISSSVARFMLTNSNGYIRSLTPAPVVTSNVLSIILLSSLIAPIGETITITGTNFKTGAQVTIGGTQATNVTLISTTSLTCKVPQMTSFGTKLVVVTNPDTTVSNSLNINIVSVLVTIKQSGNDVIAKASGAVNLTGLGFISDNTVANSNIIPGINFLNFNTGLSSSYNLPIHEVKTFGSTVNIIPSSSSSGDVFTLTDITFPTISLPRNYVSNTLLSSTMTFNNKTISEMTLTSGIYSWSWSNGNIQVII
jgi:hypothetical protein